MILQGGSIFVSRDGGSSFDEVSWQEYIHSVAISPSKEHIAITVSAGHSSKVKVNLLSIMHGRISQSLCHRFLLSLHAGSGLVLGSGFPGLGHREFRF